jgi:hypothetical protein
VHLVMLVEEVMEDAKLLMDLEFLAMEEMQEV